MVDIVLFTTPFDASQTEQFSTEPGISIARFLFVSGLQDRMQSEPIVVRLNGDEITSAQYDYVICESDNITLHTLPQGGLQILYLVVALAVSYYTYQKLGDLGSENLDDTSPTYNLNSRGNVARLGSPKPVFYGTMRTYPDLGAIPYTEFDANGDQILYQLFEVRQGQCNISTANMRFEDTPLTSFEGYEVEVIEPGNRSTIFPGLVVLSSELDSIEIGPTPNDFGDYKDMHHGVNSAPDAAYYACDIGQEITRVSMDVVADAGIYRVNPEGKLRYRAVTFRFEARQVNDSNVPIGSWFTLANASLESDAENFRAAVRRTFTYAIAKGRYEIRTVRTTTKSDNSNVNDVIKWVGLRGFVAESLPVTTTTRIALKIRASEQLGRRGAAKFNVISTGKIPTWNSGTGWGVPVVTANPAWVFADILHNSVYGAGRGDAFIDLPGLAALATQLQTAGIEFHGGFDTQTTVWDALTKVAAVAQAKPVDRAGVYYMVRDVQASSPAYMFSHANIVKDSFRLDYSGVLEETADAYRLLFLDKDQDYRETDLLCALPGSAEEKIKDIKIFGAVDKDQVFNWGMYLAAADFYRRRRVEFQTGIEGYLPFYYDTVSVSHYLIGREGQVQVSGDVIAFDGFDILTLSEDVYHLTTPYIVLRNLDGSPGEPYLVNVIGSNVVQIADVPGLFFDGSGLVFDSGFERPHFMCGEGDQFYARVKIDSIKASGDGLYTLSGFIDAPEVYAAASGLPTPPVTGLPPVINIAPVIRNFTATLSGSVDTPIVILRWESDNADYFIVQMSYDNGVTWATIAPRLLENTLNHAALIGDIKYRVCGMNVLQGQFREVEINTGSASYPAATGVTGLMLVSAFVSDFVSVMWSSTELNHKIAFYVGAVEKFVDYVSDINQYTLHAATAKENGLGRSFTVKVWSISQYGQLSASSVDLAVSNPAPAALTGISVVPSQVSIEINWNANADSDLAGYVAYMSATSGFTPSLSNRVYKGLSNKVTLTSLGGVKLNAGQTYYVRVAAFDIYGEDVLDYSSEFSATILSFASGISSGEITATMIAAGAVDMTKFASGIRPSRVVTSLPTIDGTVYKNQDTVTLTTDGKLYRAVAGVWTADVAAVNVTGTLTNAQIADLAATKITGTLTNSQIADLAATKITGQITSTQITDNSITSPKINAGAVVAGKIATDAVTANEIAANSITSAKINAGAITTAKIAAGAVTASEIAANAVTATQINAGAVTTAKIAAGAVTANEIAANAITAAKIAAGAIGATQIAANAITADKLFISTVGTVLNDDPNFADSTAWTFLNSAQGVETSGSGFYATTLVYSSTVDGTVKSNKFIQISRFKTYYFSSGVFITPTALRPLVLIIYFHDVNGNYISESYPYNAIPTQGAWNKVGVSIGAGTSFPIPTNATQCKIGIAFNSSAYGSGSVAQYAQDFRLEELIGGTLIQDGAVTTDKVAANAITAGKIAANTITATQIAAGTITGTQIAANSVTATNIDSRNLTIKDAGGTTIFSAGVPLDFSNVGGSTKPANNATVGATFGTNISGQITSANASTFIAGAAIGAAQIGSLNASVINAGSMSAAYITAGSITTDRIQVGAVTAQSHFSSSSTSTVGAASTKAIELSLGSFTSTGVESNITCACVMELGSDFASSTGLDSSTAFVTADVYLKVDGVNKVVNSVTGSVVRAGSTYFAHIPFSFVHRGSYSAGSHSVTTRFEAIFLTAAGGTQNQSSTTECTLRANCVVQENKV